MFKNIINIIKYRKKVKDFAKDSGYDGAYFSRIKNGYIIYKTYFKEVQFVGYPQEILVDKDGNMKLEISSKVIDLIKPKKDE